jgi:hypothetical protein
VYFVIVMCCHIAVWVHPKIINTTPKDLRGYWWTCVAHHVTPASRVIAPGDRVLETSDGANEANWCVGVYVTVVCVHDGAVSHLRSASFAETIGLAV